MEPVIYIGTVLILATFWAFFVLALRRGYVSAESKPFTLGSLLPVWGLLGLFAGGFIILDGFNPSGLSRFLVISFGWLLILPLLVLWLSVSRLSFRCPLR